MTGEKTLMPFVPYWELFMYLLRDPRISDKNIPPSAIKH
jgi:hypothetical protein